MIDSHCHLYQEEYKEDLAEVISRSITNGVTQSVLANVNSHTLNQIIELTNKYPDYFHYAIGLHPTEVKEDYIEEITTLEKNLKTLKPIAIGEAGIDLYWDSTYINEQKEAFATQIDWALQYDLPLIIHARKAFAETFEVFNRFKGKNLRGVFHCYSGGVQETKKILSLGEFYFGIGGVVTYKNSTLPNVVAEIPIERVILETDAPFLSPVPYRGKRNEPANIKEIAEKVASIYNISQYKLDKITTENTKNLFNI